MLKKLFAATAVALALCLIGCGDTVETAYYPSDELAVIVWYENYAWEPTSHGYIATCGGEVYLFDFIGDEEDARVLESFGSGEEALIFERLMSQKQPCGRIETNCLQECRTMSDEIDPSAGFKVEQTACDAGDESVYVMTDGGAVKIAVKGDETGALSDKAARRILKKLGRKGIVDEGWKMWRKAYLTHDPMSSE